MIDLRQNWIDPGGLLSEFSAPSREPTKELPSRTLLSSSLPARLQVFDRSYVRGRRFGVGQREFSMGGTKWTFGLVDLLRHALPCFSEQVRPGQVLREPSPAW